MPRKHKGDGSSSRRHKGTKRVQIQLPEEEDDDEYNDSYFRESEYDEEIDDAIDAALYDLTGMECDTAAIRDTTAVITDDIKEIVEHIINDFLSKERLEFAVSALQEQGRTWREFKKRMLQEPRERAYFDDFDNYPGIRENPEVTREVAREQAYMMLQSLDFESGRAPLNLTPDTLQQINQLPEKEITIYIRLDEEMPSNCCTAYEVNLKRYYNGKSTKLFKYFRICSRHANELTRQECIAGTFAAACLRPYTILTGQPLRHEPFRPKTLLLDLQEDAEDLTLRMLLNQMGLTDCQKAETRLQVLHDLTDLDCFSEIDNNNMMTLGTRLASMQFEDMRDDEQERGCSVNLGGLTSLGGGFVVSK